jgi:hypothetical protein
VRLKPATIQFAVQHEDWQKFRRSLKGKSTREKLRQLGEWMGWEEFFVDPTDSRYEDRVIQAQNYLNALARGGFIAPTVKSHTIGQQIRNAKVLK